MYADSIKKDKAHITKFENKIIIDENNTNLRTQNNSIDVAKYLSLKQVNINHTNFRFKSTKSTKSTTISKNIEEEVEFEETFNNNRNYWIYILTICIVFVNLLKIFSLIFVAIIMFAIEEKDQQQLISDQMIMDQFSNVFFKVEESFVDEDSADTFDLVNDSLFIPDATFKKWISTFETMYNLINPILASFQSNFMKNIFIRHLAGLIFGFTKF